jgi:putative endonuclease
MHHLQTGQTGENIALKYLQDKGYQILETNWRHGRAEIDIIAKQDQSIVIVEVKTRTKGALVLAEGAVNKKKRALLTNAASAYLHQEDWRGECRFDVIAIEIATKESFAVTHFEDAFFPNPTDDLW